MASFNGFGLFEIFIIALLFKLNTTVGSDVVVGVFSQFVEEESWRNFPFEDSSTSSTTGSDNWVSSNSPNRRLFNYREALSIAEKRFRKNFGDLNFQIIFREILVSSTASIAEVMRELVTNQESCDSYVFGLSTHEVQAHNIQHQVICRAGEAALAASNFPGVSWSCPKDISTPESTLIDVQPPPELLSESVMSVLHKYHWRRVAWLTTSVPEPWAQACKQVELALMSSNYFAIDYYESYSEDISTSMYTDAELNTEKFKATWKTIAEMRISAVVMCLPHGFGNNNENSTIVDELLWSAYEHNQYEATGRAYLVLEPHGLFTEKEFLKKTIRKSEPANKARRSALKNDLIYYSDTIKISDLLKAASQEDDAATFSGSIGSQADSDNSFLPNTHVRRRSISITNDTLNGTNDAENKLNIYENVMIVSSSLPQSFPQEHHEFVKSRSANTEISYLVYFLDSLYLTLIGVSQFLARNSVHSIVDGRSLINQLLNTKVDDGFSGPIIFDKQMHWRIMNYTVWDVVSKDATGDLQILPVMRVDTSLKSNGFYEIYELAETKWSTLGVPIQDYCTSEVTSCKLVPSAITGLSVLVTLIIGSSIYCFGYFIFQFLRKKKELKSYLNGPNKIFLQESDITFISPNSRGRMGDCSSNMACSRLGSIVTITDPNESCGFTYGIHKGDYVFLKQLCDPLNTEVKRPFRDALRQVRDLRHENICSFFGLYFNSNFPFLVMEYGHKRSLKELINLKEFELNWTFKMSLISDLVRGVKYIHSSSIVCHGRLKSRNCIVDGRFVLKVTDYGVNRLRASITPTPVASDNPKDLLWTAPELLNDPVLRQIGTQKGDSYSFAIICQELILRDEPFCMFNFSPEELLEKLKKPPPLIRPSVPADAAPMEIIQIMRQCWQEQPDLRLTFSAISAEMKRMNKGVKHNIIENMMKQLEDYSSHLEELVEERTAELGEEKKKTESLLMRMLPPSVAKLLLANKKIIPESFDNCTIYFSDICGFTTIAHSSTPMQVVDFLNDLYTCFDAIIEQYDVYKVETIGDAYMVSSGIPKVIGERHAEEVVLMALDIMSATTTYRVKHLPQMELRIRIGMHSGSAVAGVVGLTMPRYCLFGDTINTASRLETTGIPSRIHVSSDTATLLQKSEKKFNLQKRGTIELKGRGTMTTWWVLGLEGFNKPLPDPGNVHEPSHGIKLEKPSVNKSANNSKEFEEIIRKRRDSILQGESAFYPSPSLALLNNKNSPNKNADLNSRSRQAQSMVSTSGSSFVVATPLALIPPRPRDHFQAGQEHCGFFSNHLQNSRPPIAGSFVKAKRLQLSALFSRNNKAVAPSTDNHLLNTVTRENETS